MQKWSAVRALASLCLAVVLAPNAIPDADAFMAQFWYILVAWNVRTVLGF